MNPAKHPNVQLISANRKGVQKLLKDIYPYTTTGPNAIPGRLLKSISEKWQTYWQWFFMHLYTTRLEEGVYLTNNQEGRQTQTIKIQACIFDINMLQDTGIHCAQPRDHWSNILMIIICSMMHSMTSGNAVLVNHSWSWQYNTLQRDSMMGSRSTLCCLTLARRLIKSHTNDC